MRTLGPISLTLCAEETRLAGSAVRSPYDRQGTGYSKLDEKRQKQTQSAGAESYLARTENLKAFGSNFIKSDDSSGADQRLPVGPWITEMFDTFRKYA